MLVSRRRHSVDDYSPWHKGNWKRLDHLHHHLTPSRWSATSRPTAMAESDSWDGQSRSQVSESTRCSCGGARGSSEMLMMVLEGGGRRPRKSSHGSCGAWSMGSMLERCPATPSPVLSPVSSVSCTTHTEVAASHSQSSCIKCIDGNNSTSQSGDGKKSASQEAAGGERANVDARKPSSAPHYPLIQAPLSSNSSARKMTKGEDSVKQNRTPKTSGLMGTPKPSGLRGRRRPSPSNLMDASLRTAGLRFSCVRSTSFGTRNHNEDRRLQALSEEQELECMKGHCPTGSSSLSSDDSSFPLSSGDGYSDIESMIKDRHKAAAKARPARSITSEKRRDDLDSKLIAWKEARTLKLMNQLKQEEVAIEEWERRKIRKAKMEMKESEMRLEKMRSKATEKMQRRIRRAQKAAAKKKLKERVAADKKMTRVSKELEKNAWTGKLPWSLVLC